MEGINQDLEGSAPSTPTLPGVESVLTCFPVMMVKDKIISLRFEKTGLKWNLEMDHDIQKYLEEVRSQLPRGVIVHASVFHPRSCFAFLFCARISSCEPFQEDFLELWG